jgi:type I restriction enzyme S subunit
MAMPEPDWLPSLPGHWQLHRAKANFREVDERSVSGDEELLSVSHKTGVTPRSQKNVTMFMAESYEGHKTCKPGDIVVNTLWAWMAALGTSKHVGIVSPAYGVYRQRHDAFDPRFLDYLLRTGTYRGEYLRSSRGITTSRLRLYPPDFLNIPFVQPPLDEQRLIVRCLDWHGAMTGKLIRAKRRLIALLNEQKQSIIHRAVTRGVDPAVNLKPSGVDWLGDAPEHWDVGHLRYFIECLDGRRIPLNGNERGAKQGIYPYWGANKVIDHLDEWLFDEPLVLLGEDGAPFFLPGRDVAFAVAGKIWVNNHAHVLRCGKRLIPSFLSAALNCVDYVHFIDGSTRDKLTQAAMGSIHVQVPPIDEQRAIVDYLNEETSKITAIIEKAEAELELIQEFRTRLISDAVTGQIDVRSAAVSLPDLAESEAFGDTTDDMADEDEDALDVETEDA